MGTSIWTSPQVNLTSVFTYGCEFFDTIASLPSISRPSCSVATLPEVSPSLPDLTAQPLSPSTLNFVDQTLEPSFGTSLAGLTSFPPSVGSGVPSAAQSSEPVAIAPGHHSGSPFTAPSSGNFTEIPPISGVFSFEPLLDIPIPVTNPPLSDSQPTLPDERSRKAKNRGF